MSWERAKETPTAATVSGKNIGVLTRDTMNILAQMEFFEGFRAWCAISPQLEWRRTV